ncbi:MAG: PrsW family intramembrane metalloprotease [Phycisphaerae bacterium]|nr:PrsW family intramembrane metalloprotease [Phycisphaerae bacterium]
MKQYWVLGADRQPTGPIALQELNSRLAAGEASASDLVCEVGATAWITVGEALGAAAPPSGPPPLPLPPTSSGPVRGGSIGGLNDLASSVAGRIAKATHTEKVEYAEVHSLFSEIFRRHNADEAEAHFGVGLASTTPSIEEVRHRKPQPWFFGRILAFLGVAFIALGIAWEQFTNINVLPGMIVTGSFAAPLAMAVFFFECNQPQNISLYVVLKLFVWGGVLGIVLSLVLFEIEWPTALFGASAAALIEEPGKLAAVILLAHRSRYPWTLNGLCFGAAVGAGFAAFESAGYALMTAVLGGTDAMTQNLIVRGFLSPFAHVVWTAIAAGALWRVSRGGPLTAASFLNWRFASPFLVVVALHFTWNSSFLDGIPFYGKYLLLGGIAWIVALGLLFGGFREVSKGVLPTPE